MASITIRALSFLLPYSLRKTLEYRIIGARGFENVLKINNQNGWNNFWGFKNRIHCIFRLATFTLSFKYQEGL